MNMQTEKDRSVLFRIGVFLERTRILGNENDSSVSFNKRRRPLLFRNLQWHRQEPSIPLLDVKYMYIR